MAEKLLVAEMSWDKIYTEEEKLKMRNMLEFRWLPAVNNNIMARYELAFTQWREYTNHYRKLCMIQEEFNKGILLLYS